MFEFFSFLGLRGGGGEGTGAPAQLVVCMWKGKAKSLFLFVCSILACSLCWWWLFGRSVRGYGYFPYYCIIFWPICLID